RRLGWGGAALAVPADLLAAAFSDRRPNIVMVLADDLGWGDLGCYGQKLIRTPNLDRLAADGIRFTQAYCGTAACAPSRCSLLTGLHTGHAPIRGNITLNGEGQVPLPEGTYTVARLLREAGYATACIGKWGLGSFHDSGNPNRCGFDHFFGYTCQVRAQDHYPEHLWRNGEKIPLSGRSYSHDLFTREAKEWIRANAERSFFLYLAYTLPHRRYEVPDLGRYASEPWSETEKAYAAMVGRLDRDVGRLVALLKRLGIDENTIVFFSSDNGPRPGLERFDSGGGLRGRKGRIYEAGIRVPMIVRWPGRVPSGKVSGEPWAFWDFLPTSAALARAPVPRGVRTDGLSEAALLAGRPAPHREYFYWELHRGRIAQAIRFGELKAVRHGIDGPIELYDLAADPVEKADIAPSRPEIVRKAREIFSGAREESELWPADGSGLDEES
ncbi:MAG: hypothetical protein EHM19_09845, partial [Candidatus Latescibacterota bacterium]